MLANWFRSLLVLSALLSSSASANEIKKETSLEIIESYIDEIHRSSANEKSGVTIPHVPGRWIGDVCYSVFGLSRNEEKDLDASLSKAYDSARVKLKNCGKLDKKGANLLFIFVGEDNEFIFRSSSLHNLIGTKFPEILSQEGRREMESGEFTESKIISRGFDGFVQWKIYIYSKISYWNGGVREKIQDISKHFEFFVYRSLYFVEFPIISMESSIYSSFSEDRRASAHHTSFDEIFLKTIYGPRFNRPQEFNKIRGGLVQALLENLKHHGWKVR